MVVQTSHCLRESYPLSKAKRLNHRIVAQIISYDVSGCCTHTMLLMSLRVGNRWYCWRSLCPVRVCEKYINPKDLLNIQV